MSTKWAYLPQQPSRAMNAEFCRCGQMEFSLVEKEREIEKRKTEKCRCESLLANSNALSTAFSFAFQNRKPDFQNYEQFHIHFLENFPIKKKTQREKENVLNRLTANLTRIVNKQNTYLTRYFLHNPFQRSQHDTTIFDSVIYLTNKSYCFPQKSRTHEFPPWTEFYLTQRHRAPRTLWLSLRRKLPSLPYFSSILSVSSWPRGP